MTKKEIDVKHTEDKKSKKKSSTIKKVSKKIIKESNEYKIISPENYFFLNDGRVLKDMFELAETLENISHDVFFHHVNDSKNDFSNWIKDVFGNKDLAEEIYVIREPKQTQLIILKHIAKNKRDLK